MTPRTARPLARLAVPLVAALTVAACSSGGDDSAETTAAATTSTTVEATSTTERETTTTAEATTTTAAPAPTAPLTGLPVTDPAILTRPALAVKIDNHPEARPHAGLNQADVVYEEIVEGITRFFAIFHSTDAAPIGPVRSARTTDVDLLNQLNRPLFAWSGGNRGVVAAISQANAESRAHGQAPGYYRDQERRRRTAIEHTLMNEGTQVLWTTVVEGQGPPPQMFSFRPEGEEAAGDPAATVSMRLDGTPVTWTWDEAEGLWLREAYGDVHLDTTGAQISAQNVLVQFCDYKRSAAAAGSPEAITVGAGEAWLFSGGKVVKGTWERPDPSTPAVFKDASGATMLLTPGRTWIELAHAGVTEVIVE